ncbi:MAG: 50S ribosomal protein L6 [Acidiferrobacteraceae bacterium]|nr:50S ribosomal protein L6 [Acidiferrobacteraceae bacterium]|tara:strand:+ start:2778 stop:3305 length:528 start_codon:yes stop_codon:yes gene_type:complete
MSRIANNPISIPTGVEIKIEPGKVVAKGPKGEHYLNLHSDINLQHKDDILQVEETKEGSSAIAGTMRSLVNNLVVGVTNGFEKKLTIIGVGYRAQSKGKVLNMSLGFSHPVEYKVPDGISVETPSQTEIIVKGIDKQLVGQTAAEIRRFRPPEPYKGKGVRYEDEYVVRKQAKKV